MAIAEIWNQQAACRGLDPEIFYPVSEEEADARQGGLRPVRRAAGVPRARRSGPGSGTVSGAAPRRRNGGESSGSGVGRTEHDPVTAAFAGWPAVLGEVSAGRDLAPDLAHAAMEQILAGEATPAQIAGLIVGLRIKGETVEELAALRQAMLDAAERITLPEGIDPIDTCGTGGDRARHHQRVEHRRPGAGRRGRERPQARQPGVVLAVRLGRRLRGARPGHRPRAGGGRRLGGGHRVRVRLWPHASMPRCATPGPPARSWASRPPSTSSGRIANPAGVRRQVVGVADAGMAERMLGVLQASGADPRPRRLRGRRPGRADHDDDQHRARAAGRPGVDLRGGSRAPSAWRWRSPTTSWEAPPRSTPRPPGGCWPATPARTGTSWC